ncbi:MAG: 2-oxoacid:acceptor oxidoreductase subunit alpha [Hyphomicrobiales bacterium]|nr:2-oxoacid:acceptor oxidoreductase subunit alpha [Hyphomicrobiales bacterium]
MSAAKPPSDSISIAILGSGGAGVLTAGALVTEIAARTGWYGFITRSVGPQIRGGEAAALVRLATRPIGCMDGAFDILVAIDWNNADRFAAEIPLTPETIVIGDPESGTPPDYVTGSGARFIEIPFTEIAKGIDGGRANMLAVGIVLGLAGIPADRGADVIRKQLSSKGGDIVTAGVATLEAGIAQTAAIADTPRLADPETAPGERWLITGNEAAGLGAVRGGVRFAAAYPITPATEVLEWLAPALTKVGGTLVQAEDELASINMAIGASFGGKPALTATSGPGLALMIEALGLATASEIPIVVVDVMRGGPSTGIPTKSEQSDLNIAIYGCHGDAPHVVVAPLSVADCVFTTQWAAHLAETLQGPVIVLSDQFLGQTKAIVDRPADISFMTKRNVAETIDASKPYRRYATVDEGVSAMALPGTPGGQYTADGLTHSPRGTPSSRGEDHVAQLDKRRDKIENHDYGDHWADIDGDGDIVLLCWGSLTSACREAAINLRAEGAAVKVIALRLLAPLDTRRLSEALAGAGRVLVVEQTHSAQFARHLQGHLDLPGSVDVLARPGPLPIKPGEIVEHIKKWRS